MEPLETTSISEYEMALQESEAWKQQDAPASAGAESVDPLERYQEAFTERCKESEETLRGYGYSDEEIRLMKAYIDGELSFEEVASRAAATITTSLSCSTHNSSQYTATYRFTWTKFPVDRTNDTMTLGAVGINNSDIFVSSLGGYLSSVSYVNSSGAHVEGRTPTMNLNSEGALTGKFPLITNSTNGSTTVWAQSGFITLTINPVGSKTFTSVRYRGSYLHESANTNLTFSITPKITAPYFILTPSINTTTNVSEVGVIQKIFHNNGTTTSEFP